jgi:hypothetical protein
MIMAGKLYDGQLGRAGSDSKKANVYMAFIIFHGKTQLPGIEYYIL